MKEDSKVTTNPFTQSFIHSSNVFGGPAVLRLLRAGGIHSEEDGPGLHLYGPTF